MTRLNEVEQAIRSRIAPVMTDDIAGAIQAMAEEGGYSFSNFTGLLGMSHLVGYWGMVEQRMAGKALVHLAAERFGKDPVKAPWAGISSK